MHMFTRKAAMAFAVGTALLSATGAQAQQEVDISGFTQGCFGAGCTPMPGDVYAIPGTGADITFNGTAFNGRTANGRLAINLGNGSFGQFLLGTNPTTVGVNTPFSLLISFLQPTLQPAGTQYPTFAALITGNVSTANDGGISIEYNPQQGPWVPFMTATGQKGLLRVSMRNLDVPSGGTGVQNGLIEAQVQNVVPEPASMILLGSGLVGLAGMARRRRRKDQEEA